MAATLVAHHREIDASALRGRDYATMIIASGWRRSAPPSAAGRRQPGEWVLPSAPLGIDADMIAS